jgi:1-phosphofructokinase family hexose kinase
LLLAAIAAFAPSRKPGRLSQAQHVLDKPEPCAGCAFFACSRLMTILCVTPNVAIDRTLSVRGFTAGGVWRAWAVSAAAGGKGLNVARTLLRLGSPVHCAGPLGGWTGRRAAELAEEEGLPAGWTWIAGETRTSVIVVGDGGETTVINELGPMLTEQEWGRFTADVADAASEAVAVCISGSLPPGVPIGGLARLIVAAGRAGGRPVWVDTSGVPLAEAVAAAPSGIKINAEESGELLGRPVREPAEALAAAYEIRRRGPAAVAITLGGEGAVLATAAGAWQGSAPSVVPVNPVGSGDCFLAGLVAGLADDRAAAEALRLATACGAANAMTSRAGAIEPADLTGLLKRTRVCPVVI